mgnify:FL=1
MTFDEALFKLIKTTFETKRKLPATAYEVKQLYAFMVRNLASNDLVTAKQMRTKAERNKTVDALNTEYLKMHLDLNKIKNASVSNFVDAVYELVGLTPVAVAGEDDTLKCSVSELSLGLDDGIKM